MILNSSLGMISIHLNGHIRIFEPLDYTIEDHFILARSDKLIGCFVVDNNLVVCSATGTVSIINVESGSTQTIELGYPLLVMRQYKNYELCVGGEEQDVRVLELVLENDNWVQKQRWKAKNVPNDTLDMRVPVHITEIQVYDDLIYTGTKSGRVRCYKPYTQRKPLHDYSLSEYPILSLHVMGNQAFIYSDTDAVVGYFKQGKIMRRYKGIPGSILKVIEKDGYVYCAGADRRLHVFKTESAELVRKVFVRVPLNSLALPLDHVEEQHEDPESDDELWADLKNKKQKQ